MNIDTTSDNHVHTSFCGHARGSMEEYVQSALKNGLEKICFLEHMEEGIKTRRSTWLSEQDFDNYFSEGMRLQEKFKGRIQIRLGVEVGYNSRSLPVLLKRLKTRSWDWIGLSCHFLEQEGEDHLNLVSRKDTRVLSFSKPKAEEIISMYFNNLLEAVEHIPCNMICHLDAALRYHPNLSSFALPWQAIDTLLGRLEEKKIAVELNTSGFAIRGELFPRTAILKRILALKIPLVASSDSHTPETVGAHFGKLPGILNALATSTCAEHRT